MRRRSRVLAILLLPVLIAGAETFVLSATARTVLFVDFYRGWHALWPLKAGADAPEHLVRYFGKLTPIWSNIAPGVTMFLDPYDRVTESILFRRTWEPSTTQQLLRHVTPGGTFVDVGAHVGWYTLQAARVVGPKGRVIAVEPNRETLAVLRANIHASGIDRIVVVAPVACADSETALTLYAASRENTGESSLSRTNASQEFPIAASYMVRARRLDDIVREAGPGHVDAIKIDVEGAEFLVLKGAAETLDRDRPTVSVELIDHQLRSMGSSAAELTSFMQSHGYRAAGAYEENTIFVPVSAP